MKIISAVTMINRDLNFKSNHLVYKSTVAHHNEHSSKLVCNECQVKVLFIYINIWRTKYRLH